MQDTLKISVVKGEQNGHTIYVGVISGRDLVRMYDSGVARVDIWGPSNPKGYQRTLSPTRARSFGRYLGNGNLSPTNVLIHIRDPENGVRLETGALYVPLPSRGETAIKPLLYIVDGQHRSFGISQAFAQGWITEEQRIDVPVTFWVDDTRDEEVSRLAEAEQFETINTLAKRVRTDLAHQIVLKAHEARSGRITNSSEIPIGATQDELSPLVTYITNQLAERSSSPLMSRIVRPNVPRNTTGLPSQGQFEDSLLDNYLGSGSVLTWAAGTGLNVGSVVQLLSNYWGTIFELCPKALEDPEEYHLTKTLGVHSMNGALPSIMNRFRLPSVPSKEQFKVVLKKAEAFSESDPEFWKKNGRAGEYGGGKKAFKALARDIVESLAIPI
jgi:DGQHR domain-containing protein